jgi:hypothetical protein
MNIEKRYAIYLRFKELYRERKRLYSYVSLFNIYKIIADEFGYSSVRMISDAVIYVDKNKKNPLVMKAALLFNEKKNNFFLVYNKPNDLKNIDILSSKLKTEKYHTKTPSVYYFMYKQFLQYRKAVPQLGRYKIYEIVSEEFYYQNKNSTRNIIKKVEKILQ